jgi:hypothetical protein
MDRTGPASTRSSCRNAAEITKTAGFYAFLQTFTKIYGIISVFSGGFYQVWNANPLFTGGPVAIPNKLCALCEKPLCPLRLNLQHA